MPGHLDPLPRVEPPVNFPFHFLQTVAQALDFVAGGEPGRRGRLFKRTQPVLQVEDGFSKSYL